MLDGRAADAVNQFGLDVFMNLEREQGNLFFSPLSVATALTMAYAGAAGQTAAEMQQVLHLGAEPGIHEAFGALLTSLSDHSSAAGPELIVANSIWPRIGFPINSGFLDIIANEYEGFIESLDYTNPQAAADAINNWVNLQTDGKIQELVQDLDPNTVMVLVNSLYLKAFWTWPFDPRYTQNGSFTRADGTTVAAPMMVTDVSTAYTSINGYNIVDLPFKGGPAGADMSMVLIVPPAGGSTNLSPAMFSQIDAWLEGPKVSDYLRLHLPKFKTEVSSHLNDLLIGLGMPSAFGAADFSAMTPEAVWIDRVFHKAVIEVNEQGTEAAAATQLGFVICFAKGTPVLTADGVRAIDELQPGDLVMARDENNLEGALDAKRVEKVHHGRAVIFELHVGGQMVRTTATHPFFVKGRGWTPAGELRSQDLLSTGAGDWIAVDKIVDTQRDESVYNLRVADFHTYFVGGKGWRFALWAHNGCIPELSVNRAFDFLIRDNTTSTLLFMGRIDDPTQRDNEVTPSVATPSTDFNDDTTIDGADFLAWQRGVPMVSGATRARGDSDYDFDVDRDDFNRWLSTFGQKESTLSMNVRATAEPSKSSGVVDASNKEALVDATIAWMQALRVNEGNTDAEPTLRHLDRVLGATPISRVADRWTLTTDAAPAPPMASAPRHAPDEPENWMALVDDLLSTILDQPRSGSVGTVGAY